MSADGRTERAIAEALGLTQSAVSKYLRGKTKAEPAVEGAPTFERLADQLARGFGSGDLSPLTAMAEVDAAVRAEEDRGVVCRLHEEDEPSLRGTGCDLCVRGGASPRVEEQEVLDDLRSGLKLLEADARFASLIPSVGSNLARGKRGALGPLDVAAVPGRIFEMRGAVRVSAPPEFGASRHVAGVVLAAGAVFPDTLAALNVRADEATLGAARRLGWQPLAFDAQYEGRKERIAKALGARRKAPRALYHRGAFGIEPVMYVLGASATAVARAALELCAPPAQRD